MFSVLRTICAVVGAVVLYCALMAALWALVLRTAKRRTQAAEDRRQATEQLAVATPRRPLNGVEQRAKSWDELPAWLWRDRPWAVSVVLLGAPAVRDRTAPFVDFPNRVIDWTGMLRESSNWPRDQRLLVLSAYEMAYETPGEVDRAMSEPVTLQDVMRHMDDDEVERIRVAMQIHRGRIEPEAGLTTMT